MQATEIAAGRETPVRWLSLRFTASVWPYLGAAAAVVAAGLLCVAIDSVALLPQVSVLFLVAVLLSGVLWGFGPSLFAILLSVAASCFFFFPPIFGFHAQEPQDQLNLLVFLLAAALSGRLSADVRQKAMAAERSARIVRRLYEFSRDLADSADRDQVAAATELHLGSAFGRPIRLLDRLPADGGFENAGLRPLRTGRGVVGWLSGSAVEPGRPEPEAVLIDPLLEQAASALERVALAAEVEETRVRARGDTLREAILHSISHDLQTPLATIIGSAAALQDEVGRYSEQRRAELLAAIREEADHLDHFIANVLDLTRVRAGALDPRLEAVELADIVNAALIRTRRALGGREPAIELPIDLPMVETDLFLAERAVVALLDNAAKYCPPPGAIGLRARQKDGCVELEIHDQGVGIPQPEMAHIFERFWRGGVDDGRPAGLGLGLAVARAFVEACGGRLEADSGGRGCGARFRMRLPIAKDGGAALEIEL